jgi:U3 small nucleolar RNA-associated protein 19
MLAFQATAAAGDLTAPLTPPGGEVEEEDEGGGAGGSAGAAATTAAGGGGGDPVGAYRTWLAARFRSYRRALLSHCGGAGAWPALQVAALRGLLEAGRGRPGPGGWDAAFVGAGLEALLSGKRGGGGGGHHAAPSTGPCAEALGELLARLDCLDVRYATLGALARSAAGLGAGDGDTGRTLVDVLARLPPAAAGLGGGGDGGGAVAPSPPPKSWCGALELGLVCVGGSPGRGAGHPPLKKRKNTQRGATKTQAGQQQQQQQWAAAAGHRAATRRAWVAVLAAPLPPDAWAAALAALPGAVPGLDRPEALCDALAAAAAGGGPAGLCALAALLDLITRRGVEYPAVYAALYACLSPETATTGAAGTRARAWALADAFLASRAVPAYTAAAFAKRAARLALAAPPGPASVALATVHNILRRHPACCVLLHRRGGADAGGGEGKEGGCVWGVERGAVHAAPSPSLLDTDPYDAAASDPATANALASSLWEVAHLARHWCPAVAAAARGLLATDLSDRVKNPEADWRAGLGLTYASLLDADLARRVRKAPVVAGGVGGEGGLFGGAGWGGWAT